MSDLHFEQFFYKRNIILTVIMPFWLTSIKYLWVPLSPLDFRAEVIYLLGYVWVSRKNSTQIAIPCTSNKISETTTFLPSLFLKMNMLLQRFLSPPYSTHISSLQLPTAWRALSNLKSLTLHLSVVFEGQK